MWLLLFSLFAAAPGEVFSQSTRFELTPLVGYRGDLELTDQASGKTTDINGSGSIGLLIDWKSGPTTQWELVYSLQQTDVNLPSLGGKIDMDFHTLHLGGIYLIEQEGYTPYLGFTLGAIHVDPKDFDTKDFFSFAFTTGIKVFPLDPIGIRLDARAYGTMISGSGGILCGSAGCVARIQGDLIWQFEGNIGLIIRF